MANFDPDHPPSMKGKTVFVTGANSGIGLEAAAMFARAGAHVILGCRDATRGEKAREFVADASPEHRAELELIDLASLASVRTAAQRVRQRHAQLDVLCNNAGLMALPRTLSADGFELQFAVNHLGHFALTGLLMPALLASPSARIVTVSSTMHRVGLMRWADLDGARFYDRWAAYAQSKLANLLFAYELERRLRAAAVTAISVACHPGYAETQLHSVGPKALDAPVRLAFYQTLSRCFARSAHSGAQPTVYAASMPDVTGGDYFGPPRFGRRSGPPVKTSSSRRSHDPDDASRLWSVSVERTGVAYEELAQRG